MATFPPVNSIATFLGLENPLSKGGEWQALSWCASAGKLMASDGYVSATVAVGLNGAYWTVEEYGAPTSVAWEMVSPENLESQWFALWSCLNPTTHSGYRVRAISFGEENNFQILLERVMAGAPETLAVTPTLTLTRGDLLGISVQGGKVASWYKKGAASEWKVLKEVSDTTYTRGYVGIETKSSLNAFGQANFGASGVGNAQPQLSIRDQFPLNLLINGENMTFLVDEDFSFSNGDPGGYEAASFPIPMDLPFLERGDPVRLDCGMRVAWEGRVKEIQRSLGSKTLVQCEGNRAKLKDGMMSMIYVDRDLTRWTSPSVERQRQLAEAQKSLGSFSTGFSTVLGENRPALLATVTGAWGAVKPRVEAWYDAGPENVVAKIVVFCKYSSPEPKTENPLGLTKEDWLSVVQFNKTAGATPTEYQYLLEYPNPGAFVRPEPFFPVPAEYGGGTEAAWRYASLYVEYNGENQGVQGGEYLTAFGGVIVIGNHKLQDHGEGEYWASAIVGNVISKTSGIGAGVITNSTTYKVRQAAYYTPVFYEKIISDMAVLMGWHWGVWESLTYLCGSTEPRLDFRPYPTQPTVYAWRQYCENLDLRENIENLYSKCVVTYTDVTGKEGSVVVARPNLLLKAAGLERTLEVNAGVSTEASALELGELQLILYEQRARVTGTATITAAIHDIGGADMPAWMLKAGIDLLRVPDLPCSDVWGAYNDLPISRVECTGGETGLTTTLEFGLGPNLVETLQAQLQAATTAAT